MLSKLLPIFCGALITVSISLSSWTMKEVIDLRTRVAVLEASKVAPSEIRDIWKQVSDLKTSVSVSEQKITAIPSQGPPAWFVDQVKSMENRLNERLHDVETKIDKIPRSK